MYGDTRILEEQYDSMKAWIDFMEEHSENGIWNYKLQFGDWVALDAKEGSYFGATPNDLVATAYYAYSTGLFSKIAKRLGRDRDYDKYSKLYREVVDTFQKEYFTPRGRMAARTQTAHIVALYFDLVPDEFKQRTIETLIELLKENDGHLVTGFVGTPYFCFALSQNGRLKEAYELLLKDDFPSWLYQVKAGATTIWEHWDGIKPDGTMWSPDMNSFNHYAYGAVGEWLFRVAAGIEADENEAGFKHILIHPHIGGGLDYVNASYSTVYGDIVVSWNAEGNKVRLKVTIPHNTTASIILSQAKSVAAESENQFVRNEQGLTAHVGSGEYSFTYDI
jgi:alpha-L-rhamnosidase